MFQRRLNRLNELCANHKNKFFIHYHQQPYNSVKINENEYDLTDMDKIHFYVFQTLKRKTKTAYFILTPPSTKNFVSMHLQKLIINNTLPLGKH